MVEILFKYDDKKEGLIVFYDDCRKIGHIHIDSLGFYDVDTNLHDDIYLEISQDGFVKLHSTEQLYDQKFYIKCETIIVYKYHPAIKYPFDVHVIFDADTIKVFCKYENKFLSELGYIR